MMNCVWLSIPRWKNARDGQHNHFLRESREENICLLTVRGCLAGVIRYALLSPETGHVMLGRANFTTASSSITCPDLLAHVMASNQ